MKVGILRAKHFSKLANFTWTSDNKKYAIQISEFNVTDLHDIDKLEQFDTIVHLGVNDEQFWCGLRRIRAGCALLLYSFSEKELIEVYPDLIKENLEVYVKNGGGYIGHCGGSSFPLGLDEEPSTFAERHVDNNMWLSKTEDVVELHHPIGYPVLSEHYDMNAPLKYTNDPKRIGSMAYLWYFGENPNNISARFAGFPVDLIITEEARSHPIFSDYLNDTIRNRWGCGQGYNISNQGQDVVSSLTLYPPDLDPVNDPQLQALACIFPVLFVVVHILRLIVLFLLGSLDSSVSILRVLVFRSHNIILVSIYVFCIVCCILSCSLCRHLLSCLYVFCL